MHRFRLDTRAGRLRRQARHRTAEAGQIDDTQRTIATVGGVAFRATLAELLDYYGEMAAHRGHRRLIGCVDDASPCSQEQPCRCCAIRERDNLTAPPNHVAIMERDAFLAMVRWMIA